MYVSICVIPRDGKESQMCLKHNKLMRIVHVFSVLIVFCRFCRICSVLPSAASSCVVGLVIRLRLIIFVPRSEQLSESEAQRNL